MTKSSPVILPGSRVAALLDGRMTQLRIPVIVPPAPEADCHPRHTARHPAPYLDAYCSEPRTADNPRGMSQRWCWWQVDDRQCLPCFDVPAVPGQYLWVKEAWRTWDRHDGLIPSRIPHDAAIFYDTDRWPYEMRKPGRQRRALDMCKRMSRLTLKVTAVQVHRLQDITGENALAEGAVGLCVNVDTGEARPDGNAAIMNFAALWDRTHAGRGQGWDANPWVAALTFQTIHANIGEIREHAA